jgi:hypothetical protein
VVELSVSKDIMEERPFSQTWEGKRSIIYLL